VIGNKEMKIAFVHQPIGIISSSAPCGAIELWIYEMSRRLVRSSEVIVYAKRGHHQKKFEYDQGVRYRRISTAVDQWFTFISAALDKLGKFSLFKKIKAFIFLRNVKRPLFASSLFYFTYILQVARDLKREKCDIVHLHNFSQFVPIIRAFNPKIKIVLHMHCEWLTQLDRTMIENRLREVDLIIGCSEYITEKIRSVFPQFAERCQTVFNGVDVDYFVSSNRHVLANKNAVKRVLFVGRVSPEKGLHILLEAFQKVVKRYPKTQLEIMGSPSIPPIEFIVALSDNPNVSKLACFYNKTSYVSHLQERMLSLNIADNVTFTNFIPHRHLVNHYRQADVLVNPSFSEAFGMSLIEAMACQVPVVASRVGGMTEIVEEGKTGLLVKSGNAPELAEAILRILSDDDLRKKMRNTGRERAVDLFSWDKNAGDLLCQYKKICDFNG
jgi:glycosyltransferase involved in cell wall biosynthesis